MKTCQIFKLVFELIILLIFYFYIRICKFHNLLILRDVYFLNDYNEKIIVKYIETW